MGLMLGLYALIIFWTFMIFKVYKLMTKTRITDGRSDDEDDQMEEDIDSKTISTTTSFKGPHAVVKKNKHTLFYTKLMRG
jgi:hypothetical protein